MEDLATLGKYELRGTLGRGAMGTVYEGWDPQIERRVAIKTVPLPDASDAETAEALVRFRREAQAAGRLHHPNIVGVFDYGETESIAYIVMEFVDGPPLKSILDQHERFALADTIRIMEDVLAGLQFSHERGVVHRDIKPANVMLTSDRRAKIADFGIARIESSSMTQAGTLLGTPAYMSPEQFMGQVVDARTDIYSSGVLLYQLLTGDRPFEGGMSAIMHKALHTDPPAPSQLSVTAPPALDAVVRKAMAKRPQDRYVSANAFAEAIRLALASPQPLVDDVGATLIAAAAPATRPTPIPAARAVPADRGGSGMLLAGAAVVVLAALGSGGWWLFLRTPPAPAPPPPVTIAAAPTANPVATPPAVAPNVDTHQPAPADTPAPPPPPPPPPAKTADTAPLPPVSAPAAPPPATPAPPPAPLAAQPSEQQLAMANLATLRSQIVQWVNSRSCALLGGDVRDGGTVTLTGLADIETIPALRQGIGSFVPPGQVDWQVNGVDPVFCQALNLLHPLTPAFDAREAPLLSLEMADGETRLHDGDPIRVSLVLPDFPSRLRVDYIAHDNTVQHLYPQLADPANRIQADPPRLFKPHEPFPLGNPAWLASSPYGTDMIIAVASSEPLLDHPRPGNGEAADDYLRDLQSAIGRARQRGARLAGAAVTLETLPKTPSP